LFGSMVQKGKFSAAIPDLVRALNRVDLPTLGRPTMPQLNPMSDKPSQNESKKGLSGLLAVQLLHRLGPIAGQDFRQGIEGEINAGVQLLPFGLRRAAEHVTGHLAAVAGVANAETQAVEVVLVGEPGDDVAQAVVPAVSAALLEFGDAGRHVELIVG